jgi:aryl-alcohol dehydrogenase-like predicted oxidoreductase
VSTDENLAIAESLRRFAGQRGHTLLDLAFAWLLSRPAVASVIAGSTSPEQIRANAAPAKWQLTPEDLRELERIL